MKPIPLFGTGIKSYSQVVTAQRRLNCLYEIRVDQDGAALIVRGTSGSVLSLTLPTSPIYGYRVVNDLLYVVAGTVLYEINAGLAVTARGTMSTVAQKVEMSDNGIQIIIVDGVAGYSYVIATTTLAAIAGSFPNGCSSVACLDSFAVAQVPNSRSFYVSTVLDLTTTGWPSVIKGTKENTSDYLVAVDNINGLLVLWGRKSLEFWQDVGSAPNPFTRINGASQAWGLAAKNSRALLNNTMYFLGQSDAGGVQVFSLNGYTPVRVSTPDIESIIRDFAIYTDAVALTYVFDGHILYQLTFPTAARSFLYDTTTGFWYETQTGLGLTGRHYAELGIAFNAKNYFSDSSTGNIYQFDIHTNTDNGTPIKRQITGRHIRDGGNEFTLSELYLDMETGVGTTTGQGSDPQIMLQMSKDGGRTFGPERWARIGKQGQYKYPRVRWDRLGSSIDFVPQWTMTDPVNFVIVSGSAQPIPGTQSQE